jgi:predicted Zn-dependent protease
VLQQAGYAGSGMASMFERLQQASRLNDSNAFPYLRTHPLTSERIGEARARLGTQAGAAPKSVLEHTMMQARSRVLMDTRPDSLRLWMRPSETPEDRGGQLLTATTQAQAAVVLRDWSAADAAFARVEALVREDSRALRALALMRADAYLARGDAKRADEALGTWRDDGSRAAEFLVARIAIASGDPARLKSAGEDLQTWLAIHGRDTQAWELLGQVWEKLGQPLRSVRAQAEARYTVGDLRGAVDRLRAAQRLARGPGPQDFIEASVVDVRLRQVEGEWVQRQREEMNR